IGVLLLQILIILIAARAMGWLFRKIRQPAVIGEIVAGILPGPSLFGRVAPETFGALFPASSLSNIQLLSNFGLILFMFAVGMELRLGD
ncbi:sodium:proton antiporter, partial [Klebsiella pneumoniae]|nr:sodium:proton antiporter [Klebsiella pneumoniae]